MTAFAARVAGARRGDAGRHPTECDARAAARRRRPASPRAVRHAPMRAAADDAYAGEPGDAVHRRLAGPMRGFEAAHADGDGRGRSASAYAYAADIASKPERVQGADSRGADAGMRAWVSNASPDGGAARAWRIGGAVIRGRSISAAMRSGGIRRSARDFAAVFRPAAKTRAGCLLSSRPWATRYV
ncbi:hypothetical protein [Burkholderia mallei]|nr:hypothetical protein [Burkholderia mallei]EEP86904.1 conserved hypothetical protein [Burkholderia mallei GB8 horse 4]EES45765.1 conserved hypothetical protein [Burkholderia mallei PRL-20]ABM52462.1 hypothetical protein BMASAVP1_A0286 [Burkholderia mallei SAVP1]ABO06459.1 hypothetical protein BMA10247_2554 [Burkholderia mallei NCTC 10247]EDK58944.1 hypothetical protein BMAJHU_0621 [Burkholderia mallei JHU]